MKITISGMPGSGKTTIGKLIAGKFGLKFYSIGDLRGKMAMEHGLTLEELNKLGEKESWTDAKIDEYTKKIGRDENNFIIEGRLAYHFIPDSIKIFLNIDPKIGAERILENPRPDERRRETLEDEMKAIKERIISDKKRYQKYYGIDPYDKKQFDIIFDTSKTNIDESVETVLTKIKEIL